MILARAPLRIPVGGGGTDFPSYYKKYGGYILGFALDRYVHVVLHKTLDKKIRLKYSKTEVVDDVEQLENRVAAEALKWYHASEGIEVSTFSDVPESSGLGGSSAFCVALVTALRKLKGLNLDKTEIFASAYDIERNKAKQPGGLQDQFFAAYGGAWEIELNPRNTVTKSADLKKFARSLFLSYTGNPRTDLMIAARQEARTNFDDPVVVTNLHGVKDTGRLIKQAIDKGDYSSVGDLFDAHFKMKVKRDNHIVPPEAVAQYNELRQNGVIGGKLIGMGGGGYLLILVDGSRYLNDWLPVGIDLEGCKIVYEG